VFSFSHFQHTNLYKYSLKKAETIGFSDVLSYYLDRILGVCEKGHSKIKNIEAQPAPIRAVLSIFYFANTTTHHKFKLYRILSLRDVRLVCKLSKHKKHCFFNVVSLHINHHKI
jgi:hypothetical protein